MLKKNVLLFSGLALMAVAAHAETYRRPSMIYIPETNDFVEDGTAEPLDKPEKPEVITPQSPAAPAAPKKPALTKNEPAPKPIANPTTEEIEVDRPTTAGKPTPHIDIAPPPPAKIETAHTVRWLVLDRINGVRQYLDIAVGKSADFNGLHIETKTCQRREGAQGGVQGVPAVYAIIYDAHNKSLPRFAGWMLPTQPNAQVFTHSQYVVQPLMCAGGPGSLPPIDNLLGSTKTQGETAPQTKVSANVAIPLPVGAAAADVPLSAIAAPAPHQAVPPKNDTAPPASAKAVPKKAPSDREQ